MSNDCESGNKRWTKLKTSMSDKFSLVSASGENLVESQTNMKSQGRPYLAKFSRISQSSCYWQMPETFLGNKLASYGGKVSFNTKIGLIKIARDVQIIISGNGQQAMRNVPAGQSSIVLESDGNWRSGEGFRRNTTRQELLYILSDISEFKISACHGPYTHETELINFELEVATGSGIEPAKSVEECRCPEGYTGSSCESCAPNWYRISSTAGKVGVFGQCKKCNCGSNEECEDETGKCKVSFNVELNANINKLENFTASLWHIVTMRVTKGYCVLLKFFV